MVAALEVRCRMKSSVAMVMVKEAEALQAVISGSRERMRFMRDTRDGQLAGGRGRRGKRSIGRMGWTSAA